MAKAMPKDDMLVLCARCGLRLFDDYVVRDFDIVVITEQGQRRLEEVVAADPSLGRPMFEAAGAEVAKLLDHGALSPVLRCRLIQLYRSVCGSMTAARTGPGGKAAVVSAPARGWSRLVTCCWQCPVLSTQVVDGG